MARDVANLCKFGSGEFIRNVTVDDEQNAFRRGWLMKLDNHSDYTLVFVDDNELVYIEDSNGRETT